MGAPSILSGSQGKENKKRSMDFRHSLKSPEDKLEPQKEAVHPRMAFGARWRLNPLHLLPGTILSSGLSPRQVSRRCLPRALGGGGRKEPQHCCLYTLKIKDFTQLRRQEKKKNPKALSLWDPAPGSKQLGSTKEGPLPFPPSQPPDALG